MKRLVMILALLAAACGGKGEEAPPATGSSPPTASGSAPAAGTASGSAAGSAAAGSATAGSAGSAAGSGSGSGSAVAKADPELPTTEDFEAEATTRITEKNVEAEVKAIEKEIGTEN